MGVINITPNSFSDGGLFQSPIALQNQINSFLKNSVAIIDIGAESTAPFNDPIGHEEEKARLVYFLKVLRKSDFIKAKSFISLDTYKDSIAQWFFNELQSQGVDQERFVWNDVSGKLDDGVEEFFRAFPKARYVLCHNNAPKRALASHHMDYVDEFSNIFDQVSSFFTKALEHSKASQMIFDPCFGFSKTYEQNLILIKRFLELSDLAPRNTWLFGISKKSFLRRLWQDRVEVGFELPKDELLKKSEFLHLGILIDLLRRGESKEVIFRVHDPGLFKAAQVMSEFLPLKI